MNKRLWPVLLAVLACGLIAAGCGDDDDDDGGSDEPATEATTEATTTEDTGTDTGDTDLGEAGEAAVQACKDSLEQSLAAAPQISDETRSELEDLCDQVGEDPEAAAEAAVEVCKSIAEETVPEGAARDQAVQACDSVGATP